MKNIKKWILEFYWSLRHVSDTAIYKIKKYFSSLFSWLAGIGRKDSFFVSNMKKIDTLVICAHPDDETIFFYSVLKKYSPFIICMSHVGDRIRRHEFYKALNDQNVSGMMMNFPDVKGMTWAWKWFMKSRVKRILKAFPDVNTIYTHAGYGESGHPHHFCVHNGVLSALNDDNDISVFCTANTFSPNQEAQLTTADVDNKMRIIREIYSTQVNMLVRWCPWFKDYLLYEYFHQEG